jgi:hypothetical protein
MINNLNLAVGYPNKTIVNCESGFNINLYVFFNVNYSRLIKKTL